MYLKTLLFQVLSGYAKNLDKYLKYSISTLKY